MSTRTASTADQERLLDLQALDTALDRARSRMQQLRQDPEYAGMRQALADAEETAVQTGEALEEAREQVRRAEEKVSGVREHRTRNQSRLDAGQGSARDLEHMMHELETLADLQDAHETEELEALQVQEEAEAADARARADLEAARTDAQAKGTELKEEAADVAAEGQRLTAERATLAGTLPTDLVELYDGIRARSGGVGAARLVGNRSEASGMPLSPADLAEIEQTPAETIVLCPDSGAILVRGAGA